MFELIEHLGPMRINTVVPPDTFQTRNSKILDPQKSSTTIKIVDFGTGTKVKSLKSKYFDMPPEEYWDSPIGGGIRSLFYIGEIAKKQALQILVPPTIILRMDHQNMFIYTKAATK